jgi:putative endonuclease
MKPCVYILKFTDTGLYYIGSTSDINRRVNQHKSGHTYSTKRLGKQFKLVFIQEVDDLRTARKIEIKIKSWKRKDFIEKIVNDGKIRIIADEGT